MIDNLIIWFIFFWRCPTKWFSNVDYYSHSTATGCWLFTLQKQAKKEMLCMWKLLRFSNFNHSSTLLYLLRNSFTCQKRRRAFSFPIGSHTTCFKAIWQTIYPSSGFWSSVAFYLKDPVKKKKPKPYSSYHSSTLHCGLPITYKFK